MSWETRVGVEVHVQLATGHKLFCRDTVRFGDEPNAHVCPVCLGLPGALPVIDPEAVQLAVRTALALGCEVHATSAWARKNYFYPDLPKGYQITQFERPFATGGAVEFDGEDGATTVRIRRVHLEEDAGKSLHDRVPGATAVDLNRAGTPLVEIVTEPDLRSPADVRAFLAELKRMLEYARVSDCSMEEGSLRVDANVSVRPAGQAALGTKAEIKNVNSFAGIERAVGLEVVRQVETLAAGGVVEGVTLLWDDHRSTLRPMRSKEESHDYRYFPEPDLPELLVGPEVVAGQREALPELPRARRARLIEEYGLTPYDAGVLTQSAATAGYFEDVARRAADAKRAANWVMGPLLGLANRMGVSVDEGPVPVDALVELLALLAEGAISDSVGKEVLEAVAVGEGGPREIVAARGLEQVRDEGRLVTWVEETLAEHTEEAQRARAGEHKLVGFLVGRVMHRSRGKADPRRVSEILRDRLG